MDCLVCGGIRNFEACACVRCKRILDRIEASRLRGGIVRRSDKQARIEALCDSWDPDLGGFRCFYTGVALNEDDPRDDRYICWDHRVPGDESSVVVTCALVSRMKTGLSEDQFRELVTALHAHFAGGAFDESALPGRRQGPPTGVLVASARR